MPLDEFTVTLTEEDSFDLQLENDVVKVTEARWGRITGDINDQEDLMDELDDKYDPRNFRKVTNTMIEEMFR